MPPVRATGRNTGGNVIYDTGDDGTNAPGHSAKAGKASIAIYDTGDDFGPSSSSDVSFGKTTPAAKAKLAATARGSASAVLYDTASPSDQPDHPADFQPVGLRQEVDSVLPNPGGYLFIASD